MSTGVKKPPVAPKPKLSLLVATKPSPPPIAPKPDLPLTQPSTLLEPSPATLKRAKPAVAPKPPCLPKPSTLAPSSLLPKRSLPLALSLEGRQVTDDNLSDLNSKNVELLESSICNSDYIISTCCCSLQDCSQCQQFGNGNATDSETDDLLPNGNSTESLGKLATKQHDRLESSEDLPGGSHSGDGEVPHNIHPKHKDKPHRQRRLEKGHSSREGQRTVDQNQGNGLESLRHEPGSVDPSYKERETTVAEIEQRISALDTAEADTHSCIPVLADSDTVASTPIASEIASPTVSPNPPLGASEPECVYTSNDSSSHSTRFPTDPCVPAPPSKPLPVPQPRKSRKPALVRQGGLEGSTQEGGTTELHIDGGDGRVAEGSGGLANLSLTSEEELGQGVSDCPQPPQDAGTVEEEPDAPMPPPRQTSLPPDLRRKAPPNVPHPLNKNTSHSLDLLSPPELKAIPPYCKTEAERQQNEEEDGYGDFERYPITRSLPKQIKLSCHGPSLATARKAFSAEEGSPKAPPRKPQRHSLPAARPPSFTPPAPPHAITPMRELPAPPQEKPAWRFRRPSVTFFSRQMPSRSSVPPKGRAPLLGGKQRAKSFSAADLATHSDGQKRSLSFRKLMELRLSVKILPRLLAKGGQSLDCTTVESDRGENILEQPNSSTGVSREDGDGSVEYENVPLYEEIPEYMNLPFHSARLGRPLSLGGQDTLTDIEVYEVQDPYESSGSYEKFNYNDYESSWQGQDDIHSEEEEVHSSDEDDNSSTSSKEHLDLAEDRQQEDEMKRKKVVHIAQEIMSSEKVFVDVLKLLHIDFRDAVAKVTRQNGKPVLEERILNQILYYLPQLYQLNRDLLRELEERVAHWGDHQRLADIFVQKGPYLKMYSTYIRQFDNNVALLDEQCRKNPGFAAVVREFEMSPRCASLALKHYLLKPVQRIPQYQLLLTDYLKNLPEDCEDYKDTQAALGIVKEVANHANDIMKQGDNFQKLMQIQYSLNGQHEIVQPGRVFLKEGTLMKLSRKVMQPRMFFLFNDALMYTTPVQSVQYKLNSMLSLAGMKVSKPSQEAYQNELNIESVERSFILSASSATERDEWLEAIAKAIDDYTKKKITFISSRSQEEADGLGDSGAPLGSKAPIWIPDLRATMCMICTCEFTLTWRRHHCRACGKVVCQTCSTNKYYLEYLKNQPARVCDHCFTKLQENSASAAVSPSGKPGAFTFSRKQKKIPAALKEVSANTENSSMSGYLQRSKGNKKQWKRLWFVIKNKVLYTYAASEDVAALESQPLLGFFLREEKFGPAQKLQFKLYHKNTLFYIFKADDIPTAQRWIEAFQEAMIL
ncbi:FYVE, RhoGEF and PH domain-containing protein 6-like [Aplochiton taeniatus]